MPVQQSEKKTAAYCDSHPQTLIQSSSHSAMWLAMDMQASEEFQWIVTHASLNKFKTCTRCVFVDVLILSDIVQRHAPFFLSCVHACCARYIYVKFKQRLLGTDETQMKVQSTETGMPCFSFLCCYFLPQS